MKSDQRSYPRLETEMRMQVYTSLCAAAYTVEIDNINPNGAFVKSKHLPEIGETISFNVCDSYFRYLYSGSAKVKRLVEENVDQESGFAIEFDSRIGDTTYTKIIQ